MAHGIVSVSPSHNELRRNTQRVRNRVQSDRGASITAVHYNFEKDVCFREGQPIARLPRQSVRSGNRHPILLPDRRGWTGHLAMFVAPEGSCGYAVRAPKGTADIKRTAAFPIPDPGKSGGAA